ncbi:phosphoheptose isomerase [Methylacidiphilum kamchatkense Kam1]|uniref:D-sedoheptulose 7-phosphate isomerase n=1 Tax=Methylacidiphilum kamchatkense Kam1 TaxID=1202785 RepID=A0A0C1UQS4_9BACT|nr:SIS domain-containing protein [Methylacidiphilum kamchatkense]KIE58213.1 phosphoheptose isomerase [Methylacidiphilum kamchatkense Kam1]QDQ42079.1 D-sedoheptulose 7-phosphate isomerase [Methylacidiphilum kamchatkense Kam1]
MLRKEKLPKELNWIRQRVEKRNELSTLFFQKEALSLATICQQIASRFLNGGRILAFGRGSSQTDAQHVSVEFVHPVIVGKRALPALDISADFFNWLKAICKANDIVFGFSGIEGDVLVEKAIDLALERGALTLALPGKKGSYFIENPSEEPFIFQEIVEILYHTLWETVHLFFERRQLGQSGGEAHFLYPFLGRDAQPEEGVIEEVSWSIREKAKEDERLRLKLVEEEGEKILQAAKLLKEKGQQGAKIILFGNGGSATDANDFALDLLSISVEWPKPLTAYSLSMEPAVISALANDVGAEVIFSRQLMAHLESGDVVVGISTSGGSRNVLACFEEARKKGLSTIAILGYDGGEIVRRGLADLSIIVRSDYIPRIQEVQATVYHLICELLIEEEPVGKSLE